MRTNRLSWLLLLAAAVALSGVVAVLAPSDDLQRRAVVPPPRVVDYGSPAVIGPSHDRWPFRPPSDLPDLQRMILY